MNLLGISSKVEQIAFSKYNIPRQLFKAGIKICRSRGQGLNNENAAGDYGQLCVNTIIVIVVAVSRRCYCWGWLVMAL